MQSFTEVMLQLVQVSSFSISKSRLAREKAHVEFFPHGWPQSRLHKQTDGKHSALRSTDLLCNLLNKMNS